MNTSIKIGQPGYSKARSITKRQALRLACSRSAAVNFAIKNQLLTATGSDELIRITVSNRQHSKQRVLAQYTAQLSVGSQPTQSRKPSKV